MTSQETKTAEPTPEQLLKLLDLQIASQRAKRGKAPRQRAAMLVAGLLFIFVATGGALLFLLHLAEDLPRPATPPAAEALP